MILTLGVLSLAGSVVQMISKHMVALLSILYSPSSALRYLLRTSGKTDSLGARPCTSAIVLAGSITSWSPYPGLRFALSPSLFILHYSPLSYVLIVLEVGNGGLQMGDDTL